MKTHLDKAAIPLGLIKLAGNPSDKEWALSVNTESGSRAGIVKMRLDRGDTNMNDLV